MNPNDRLNRFIADSGAGIDALGRASYTGPFMMGAGPNDFARTQAVHKQLEADAMAYDPQGNRIRQLMDMLQRQQKLPGTVDLPKFDAAVGDASYHYSIDNRGNGVQ